jgi:O-antigen/teichoic acid export membrane protein
MLAAMTSVNEVGIYAVSFRSASIVLFVSTAFGQAWSPIAIKIRTDYPVKYRIIYGDILLLLLYVMLVIGSSIALFSGEVIGLVLTKQYYLSALPLSILCFGIVLQSTQQVTAIGISLEKQTRLFARLAWVTALINLLANWYLIPRFGAAGAAWGTLIAYAALTTGYLYYTQCMHPMSIAWNKLLALLLMGTAVAIVSVTCVSYVIDLKSLIFKLTSLAFLISIGLSIIASLPSRKLAQ